MALVLARLRLGFRRRTARTAAAAAETKKGKEGRRQQVESPGARVAIPGRRAFDPASSSLVPKKDKGKGGGSCVSGGNSVSSGRKRPVCVLALPLPPGGACDVNVSPDKRALMLREDGALPTC